MAFEPMNENMNLYNKIKFRNSLPTSGKKFDDNSSTNINDTQYRIVKKTIDDFDQLEDKYINIKNRILNTTNSKKDDHTLNTSNNIKKSEFNTLNSDFKDKHKGTLFKKDRPTTEHNDMSQ